VIKMEANIFGKIVGSMNSPLKVRAGRFHRGLRAWRVCEVCMAYLGGLVPCRHRAEAAGTRLWKAEAKGGCK